MSSRLENNEDNHPHLHPPTEATGLLLEDTGPSSRMGSPIDDMRHGSTEHRRELPAVMWPQFFASFAAVMGGMAMGTTIGWTGPALMYLNTTDPHYGKNAEFNVSSTDSSWIGSLAPMGALFGGLAGGYLIGKYGRKPTMYMSSATFVAGYTLMLCAQNPYYLYFGRFVCGLASGLISVAGPTYVAEIASPHVRGLLGSGFQVLVTIGLLYVAVIGTFVRWTWITVSCLAVLVVWVVAMLFIPETPTFLLSQKKYDAARSALEFLRGHPYVEAELAEIQESVEESTRRKATLKDLGKPQNLKPLLISILLMFGQQFSGVNAVIFNSVTIFEAAHTKLNSFVENDILAISQVVATVVGALIVDRYGRRCLLMSSGVIMALSISSLGAYFFVLKEHGASAASSISFLPLPSLCIYILAFSLGFGAIPWLMMSELMAPEVKALSTSIAAASNWAMAFAVTQSYPYLADGLGKDVTFWAFGGCMVITVVLIVIFVPETKGKSLEEIQQYFRSNVDQDPMLDRQQSSEDD